MTLRTKALVPGVLVLTVVLTAALRIAGPSDLYEKTQPKTIAYTADMAANHRYLLPRDVSGDFATKPPLYNWVALPVVGWLGATGETAHKTPALLSALVLLALTVWMARRLFAASGGVPAGSAGVAALAVGCVFVGSPETFKWCYIARPDGVLMALLAAGWVAATANLEGWSRRPALSAAAFWGCTGAGILAKGPVGLLPLVYAVALTKFRHGGFARLKRLHFLWGVPLALCIVGAWAVPVWRAEPEHCRDIFLGRELIYHVVGDEPGGFAVGWLGSIAKSPLYFMLRFLPWSLFVIAALAGMPPRKWASHPMGPAIVWCAVVVLTFCFVAMVKHRYLAPAYPAAAVLAVHGAHRVLKQADRAATVMAVLGLTVCVGLGLHNAFWSNAARVPLGDSAARFARNARRAVGKDSVVFLIRGDSPVQALMGHNQVGLSAPATDGTAEWLVAPMADTPSGPPGQLIVASEPLARVIPGQPDAAVCIALFHRPREPSRGAAGGGGWSAVPP